MNAIDHERNIRARLEAPGMASVHFPSSPATRLLFTSTFSPPHLLPLNNTPYDRNVYDTVRLGRITYYVSEFSPGSYSLRRFEFGTDFKSYKKYYNALSDWDTPV